ncbi:1-acylglycerol-3-phosphate O-acyltransferase [Marinomonas algicola]|uniref:1-acylglycerol-3-phosphate O-acyltransferase n=1 Tax=Marinomonas algicola TaxID=2773454 RepID=UPI0030841E20
MPFFLSPLLFILRSLLLVCILVSVTFLGLAFFIIMFRSLNKVYYVCHAFAYSSRFLGMSVEARLSDQAERPEQAVYVGNHQNNFDLFIFPTLFPKRTVTVGKKSIVWIPIFGLLYWASGNILINRTNRQKARATIDQIVDQMKVSHLSIWMFPEGTRSRGRGLLPFKTGAFHAAIKAGLPIVPVVSSLTHNKIKLSRWNNGRFIVEMLPPIPTKNMTVEDIPALIEQCHQMMEERSLLLTQECEASHR